jgi:hypothetical protein
MRARSLGLAAVAVVVLAGSAWWVTERREIGAEAAARGPVLPSLAARIPGLDGIEVVGAGDAPLVSLHKVDGEWRMADRDDWPANQRQIGDALRLLAGAERVEAKTADPKRWVQLGVEDVALADAKGLRLVLSGGGDPLQLTIGNNHPALGGSYVRVADESQVWLADVDLAPSREANVWLDRRLVDIPVARIESMRIAASGSRPLEFARVDDRFGLDGQRPEAMADPDDGIATAGFTDQLALDEVAKDSGAEATHTAVFTGVDGVELTVQAWRDERGTWARLQPTLDEAKAQAWFARAAEVAAAAEAAAAADAEAGANGDADTGPVSLEETAAAVLRQAEADAQSAGAAAAAAPVVDPDAAIDPQARLAALRTQVAGWQARFAGRQFLLPDYKSALLLKTRDEYLAGAPR